MLLRGANKRKLRRNNRLENGVGYYQADMKTVLRILGWVVLAAILLMAGAMWYSVEKRYTRWYFRVNGQVTVDGHKSSGYMHADTQKTILLVTRTDGRRPETYLVTLGDEKVVLDCNEWYPPRFLPFPIGDVNPPCSALTDSEEIADAPVTASLVRRAKSVEFSTASGKKIKAEW